MKLKKQIFLAFIIFAAAELIINLILFTLTSGYDRSAHADMNRIVSVLNQSLTDDDISLMRPDIIEKRLSELSSEYGYEEVKFISCSEASESLYIGESRKSVLWTVNDCNGIPAGFAVFYPEEMQHYAAVLICNLTLLISFSVVIIYTLYIYRKIISPFNRFSSYPEKLSKGYTSEKIPETKNRYFGKFIWGINMLADKINSSGKTISRLEYERQKMLTSIAHGVKTPVMNIKLYSEAIRTGLYSGGKTTPEDMETAEKIYKNADLIEELTTELINKASHSVYEYEPVMSDFYMKELEALIDDEYSEKMKLLHIPFKIICNQNPLMHTDQDALMNIIVQITENALKYGNGKGITIEIDKQDDSFCISVKNKGNLLPEDEMQYIFRSFWRGSNAAAHEGNGIGMYISQKTARALGGNIYAARHEDTSEMEFIIIL